MLMSENEPVHEMLNGNAHQIIKFMSFKRQNTVKLVLSGHSKRKPKIGFQDRLSLHAGQKYCRMLQESILQYFRPSSSYHLSLRPLFCLFLSGCLKQVFLYVYQISLLQILSKISRNKEVTCI